VGKNYIERGKKYSDSGESRQADKGEGLSVVHWDSVKRQHLRREAGFVFRPGRMRGGKLRAQEDRNRYTGGRRLSPSTSARV